MPTLNNATRIGNVRRGLPRMSASDIDKLPAGQQTKLTGMLNERLEKILLDAAADPTGSIQKLIKDKPADYSQGKELNLLAYFDKNYLKSAESLMQPDELKSLRHNLETKRGEIGRMLSLDSSIKDHPILGKEHRKNAATQIAEMAGIKSPKLEKFVDLDLRWDDLNEATLLPLIKSKLITKAQAEKLIFLGKLARLTADNIPLIRLLLAEKITDLKQLLKWTEKDWLELLKTNKIDPPEGEDSLNKYVENMMALLKKIYAGEVIAGNQEEAGPDKLLQLLKQVASLRKENDKLIHGRTFEPGRINWKGVNQSQKAKMIKVLVTLTTFSNRYKGLGFREVINDNSLSNAILHKTLRDRLAAFDTFRKNNPELNYAHIDFIGNKNFLDWTGINDDHEYFVQKQLMSLQRIERLSNNTDEAENLMTHGYDSAMSIASVTEDKFYADTGLSYESSRRIYLGAKGTASISSNYFEAVRDGLLGTFQKVASNNQSNLVNDLREIHGFDELFGNQDFCKCKHCKSIFGPAAYFVDLMHFIDEQVSQKHFDSHHLNHPLYLNNRRPDLWQLPLTCENTTQEIPYLQIVNEVLESFLTKNLPTPDVFKFIAKSNYSPQLPVNVPLRELRIYLQHFDESLFEIYKTLKEPKEKIYAAKLELDPVEIDIIKTEDRVVNHKRFGEVLLSHLRVQTLLEYLKISRRELDEILATKFIATLSGISIVRKSDSSDIQKFHEEFSGLTKLRLDYLFRYLKLWKKTPWSIPELDLHLNQLKSRNIVTSLDDSGNASPRFLTLGQLAIIQDELNLSTEELAALTHELPVVSVKDDQKPFFERIFDLEKLFGISGTSSDGSPVYNSTFVLPSDKNVDDKSALILAGLGIPESDFIKLSVFIGLDLSQNLTISHSELSKWFKNSLLARSLNFTMEEYMSAASLIQLSDPANKLDDIQSMIEFRNWLNTARCSIADLLFIIHGVESTNRTYENSLDDVVELILGFQKDEEHPDKQALLIAWLLNEFNLTEDQLLKDYNDYLLSKDFFHSSVTKALTATFDPVTDVPVDLSDFDGLLSSIHEMERWNLLIEKLELDTTSFSFLVNEQSVFGLIDFTDLTLKDLRQIEYYNQKIADADEIRQNDIRTVLIQFQKDDSFNPDSISILASLFEVSSSTVSSAINVMSFPSDATAVVAEIEQVIKLSKKLGLEGLSLKKLTIQNIDANKVARDIVWGAITARYPNETLRQNTLEPYSDAVNVIRRDALCDAIIGKKETYKFMDRSDLYHFFLLDVEMSGCFKTSRVVCANSSLQLYVHRCLLNLERSDPHLNPSLPDVSVKHSDIPEEEWMWRNNYRVWEANRKVFLYPENYIDPALRDTKTDIFKELEDELLQEKITQQSAEEAYTHYMSRFSELTKLRYAGAYYHSVPLDFTSLKMDQGKNQIYFSLKGTLFSTESPDSTYYLFARTNTDPFQYYYRTYQHVTNTWGNWKKMNVAIEAHEISCVIRNGRVYIFWNEVVHKEISRMDEGNRVKVGHNFKVHAKYSYLKEDDTWTTPQKVYVGQTTEAENVIFNRVDEYHSSNQDTNDKKLEAVLDKYQQTIFRKPVAIINPQNNSTPISLYNLWTQEQGVSDVDYTVGGNTVTLLEGTVKITLPAVTFNVIGNNFSTSTTTRTLNLTIEVGSIKFTGLTMVATITLFSATNCIIEGFKSFILAVGPVTIPFPILFNISLPVSAVTDPPDITYSRSDLSLSKKEILNTHIQDMKYFDTLVTAELFLNPEYLTAYNENGDFDHYIETGSKDFTDTFQKIHQSSEGPGHLLIPGTGSNLDTTPITTILTDEILDILYARGLEEFLSLPTQNLTDASGHTFDMTGSYGEYYWEIFFHIPFLIANHLNANQKFKEAKWWYERIFNPTMDEDPSSVSSTDHYWQFREFRNLGPEKLQDILSDTNAIEAYKEDPFDPHAIARLRISAYQKSIVMKYIDNLIDWGDHLFSQDTRESITEAMQYYQLAHDLLGKRPVELGECITADTEKLTYDKLKDKIEEGSEFLISLENSYWVKKDNFFTNLNVVKSSKSLNSWMVAKGLRQGNTLLNEVRNDALYRDFSTPLKELKSKANSTGLVLNAQIIKTSDSIGESQGTIPKYEDMLTMKNAFSRNYEFYNPWKDSGTVGRDDVIEKKPNRMNAFELVKESVLVFCIPENGDLLAYWDRLEDRLFKIRHCMNISGAVRSLALLSPAIDPNFLVRAMASGLSLEDVMRLVTGAVKTPAYRFVYLIEKARQFTLMVQGLGNALLSAMEKKDIEELNLLRSVHEQNILKLTENIKMNQLDEASAQYEAMQETMVNVQNQIDYYSGLINTGLLPWETTQQISRHAATALRTISTLFYAGGGIVHLIPQLGSPFAMKWGGHELGHSAKNWASFMNGLASIADDISASAGLEATFQRRDEEWRNQMRIAIQEAKITEKQVLAAELRVMIAEKDLNVHIKSIEQARELHDFYKNKFTRLGLYDYLSSNLNRIFRESYNVALGMAKTAELAYQFETFDTTFFIANDNWDTTNAGLLSGDRLLLQLSQMESSFIENNIRIPEIIQTFSMALLSPGELNNLRQTGSCSITIPEVAFELFYPGQYRRLIKGLRLTIPSVVGPYTNVSAQLTLTKGQIEPTDGGALIDHPIGVNTSITTSGGVNDTGMFEFNLRDERYLPFEGAGAISEWRLDLPANIRHFDYNAISDVLITMQYTALNGDRNAAETVLVSTLKTYSTAYGMYKLISLRYEFPTAYHSLMHPDANGDHMTTIELSASHFPYFLRGESLSLTETIVYIKPRYDVAMSFPGSLKMKTKSVTADNSKDIAFVGTSGGKNKLTAGTVSLSGDPAGTYDLNADAGSLDDSELEDILILMKYKVD